MPLRLTARAPPVQNSLTPESHLAFIVIVKTVIRYKKVFLLRRDELFAIPAVFRYH